MPVAVIARRCTRSSLALATACLTGMGTTSAVAAPPIAALTLQPAKSDVDPPPLAGPDTPAASVQPAPLPERDEPPPERLDPPAPKATTVEPLPSKTSPQPVTASLPPLQIAGWWTLFGAVALATVGGVFVGLTDAQEDRAIRLASTFDGNTGRFPLFADKKREYNDIVARGRAYERASHALLIAGGATALAGLALFIIDYARAKNARERALARSRGRAQLRSAARLGHGHLHLRF